MGQREIVGTTARGGATKQGNGDTPVPVLGIDALNADPLRGWLAGLRHRPSAHLPSAHRPSADLTAAGEMVGQGKVELFEQLGSGQVSGISFESSGSAVDDPTAIDDLSSAGLAIAAYLRGDFSLALRHAGNVRSDNWSGQVFATSTKVLAMLAVGDPQAANDHLRAAVNPFPLVATALSSMIGGDEFGQLSLIPTVELTDPMIAVAAVAALASGDRYDRRLDERIEILSSAVDGGCRFTTTIPLSPRRALAAALAVTSDLEAALEHLRVVEEECRREEAVCELVEVLILASSVNALAGRRDWSEAKAIEADFLAERLGMLSAQRRSRKLYRISQPGEDLREGPLRAIMMSDVVGSSEVSHSQGDEAYYQLVMEHHELVRRHLVQHDGTEFSEGGDSLFVWFNGLTEAMDCAIAIQEEADQHRRSGGKLSVRVAVAAGRPFFGTGEERPYGSVVNRAARMNGQAEPDEIVVDEVTLKWVSPVIEGFDVRAVDLRGLGPQTIGILDLGTRGD